MNGEHVAILNITLDCADARAQASFWAAALGWTAREQDDAPGLGATVLDDQPPGAGWLIVADPEGNEFCLEGAATG
jgi:predicted enzyme related to lactoylglutathione lyase